MAFQLKGGPITLVSAANAGRGAGETSQGFPRSSPWCFECGNTDAKSSKCPACSINFLASVMGSMEVTMDVTIQGLQSVGSSLQQLSDSLDKSRATLSIGSVSSDHFPSLSLDLGLSSDTDR